MRICIYLSILLAAFFFISFCDEEESTIDFTEFSYLEEEIDVEDSVNNLCDVPYNLDDAGSVSDKVFIECRVEGASFSDIDINNQAPDSLRVVVWNMERGLKIDDQINVFQTNENLMNPDILILQEVDRGCLRTDNRNISYDLAEALGLNYVYAVEFVELNDSSGLGEHGNAIMSRYPIGNIETLRHTPIDPLAWWDDSGEPRLGGRIALYADIVVGNRLIKLVTLHLESKGLPDTRGMQMQEALDLISYYSGLIVLGGDLNTAFLDYTGNAHYMALNEGYIDVFQDLSFEETYTHPGDILLRLDWAFHKGFEVISRVVPHDLEDDNLSDHLPLSFEIKLSNW